eukprot:GHVT01047845.1.p1 GENE.GHVT01047845.1~~GHVT01047845.1.p1  ORF type:complete len:819 (-),score=151.52 GHVT01047845.1:1118-3574(-)
MPSPVSPEERHCDPTHPTPGMARADRMDEFYETERVVQFIRGRGFRRVAFQFPNELLGDAPAVVAAAQRFLQTRGLREPQCVAPVGQPTPPTAPLVSSVSTRPSTSGAAAGGDEVKTSDAPNANAPQPLFFILADSPFGGCCVDHVAANRLAAECIIHYGPSCQTPSALPPPLRTLPVLFVFARLPLPSRLLLDLPSQQNIIGDKATFLQPTILVHDVALHYGLPALIRSALLHLAFFPFADNDFGSASKCVPLPSSVHTPLSGWHASPLFVAVPLRLYDLTTTNELQPSAYLSCICDSWLEASQVVTAAFAPPAAYTDASIAAVPASSGQLPRPPAALRLLGRPVARVWVRCGHQEDADTIAGAQSGKTDDDTRSACTFAGGADGALSSASAPCEMPSPAQCLSLQLHLQLLRETEADILLTVDGAGELPRAADTTNAACASYASCPISPDPSESRSIAAADLASAGVSFLYLGPRRAVGCEESFGSPGVSAVESTPPILRRLLLQFGSSCRVLVGDPSELVVVSGPTDDAPPPPGAIEFSSVSFLPLAVRPDSSTSPRCSSAATSPQCLGAIRCRWPVCSRGCSCARVTLTDTSKLTAALSLERFAVVERCSGASSIGILFASAGLPSGASLRSALTTLVRGAGRTCGSYVVGQMKIAKLENFPDVEAFCLVTCPEQITFKFRGFSRPVCTPYELLVALGDTPWNPDFILDPPELTKMCQQHGADPAKHEDQQTQADGALGDGCKSSLVSSLGADRIREFTPATDPLERSSNDLQSLGPPVALRKRHASDNDNSTSTRTARQQRQTNELPYCSAEG